MAEEEPPPPPTETPVKLGYLLIEYIYYLAVLRQAFEVHLLEQIVIDKITINQDLELVAEDCSLGT